MSDNSETGSDGGIEHDADAGGDELATDGGRTDVGGWTKSGEDRSDVEIEEEMDYLNVEINLLKPGTPFMRDHNRIILTGFALWVFFVFGPITATRLAPGLMTSQMPILGFPFHYFAIAIGSPSAALLLSVWYVRRRDKIDEKYGIEQTPSAEMEATEAADEAAATDGGVAE